ncbi:MAG: glycosyltransferase [Desulfobulbaceae bacterium]|jgi:GT2 family glycosyltransferase|nr:glycosyltransferase [Desulfobulbaceae bacterium]
MNDLNISIVTYSPCIDLLAQTTESLLVALLFAHKGGNLRNVTLYVVDNGPGHEFAEQLGQQTAIYATISFIKTKIISGHGNIGFGRGHNLAWQQGDGDFHLILNPDVYLEENAIHEALGYMTSNEDVGLLSPYASDENGQRQYLCKRYPSLLNFGLRGCGHNLLTSFFRGKLDHYEMRSLCGGPEVVVDVPIVSGCFMFFRYKDLSLTGGFADKYFLYFEDFDLSLRLAKRARIAFVPQVRVIHSGGKAARKGWWHITMFTRSAITFFNAHGWKIF